MKRLLSALGAASCAATIVCTATFSAALAQPAQSKAPPAGSAFSCHDGGNLVLSLVTIDGSLMADVWVHGALHRLSYLPPEPGPVQIVWSDGESSLTWSPGVKLMWMSGETHLMCGRSHQH